VSIWGLTWPWAKKKGRTIESYDKRGRLRILCANGGALVTGEIALVRLYSDGRPTRWTSCPECDGWIKVTGPKAQPRLTVHKAVKKP
jgi:hypothetical protein